MPVVLTAPITRPSHARSRASNAAQARSSSIATEFSRVAIVSIFITASPSLSDQRRRCADQQHADQQRADERRQERGGSGAMHGVLHWFVLNPGLPLSARRCVPP